MRRRVQLPRAAEVEEMIGVLLEFIDRAELISLESCRGERGG